MAELEIAHLTLVSGSFNGKNVEKVGPNRFITRVYPWKVDITILGDSLDDLQQIPALTESFRHALEALLSSESKIRPGL